jgi:hypothetical protein
MAMARADVHQQGIWRLRGPRQSATKTLVNRPPNEMLNLDLVW